MKPLLIKAPCSALKEVLPLCRAGADEFFCGVEPPAWKKVFKDLSMNQRQSSSNFTSLGDLRKAVRIAHDHGARVHLTLNAFFYLQEQYRLLEALLEELAASGCDGFIVAEPAVLEFCRRKAPGKELIVGCDAVVLNSSAVTLFRGLGASRIVLPRDMTLPEMRALLAAAPGIEYEAFIINDLCFFEDGFCAYCKEASGEVTREGRPGGRLRLFSSSRIPGRGFSGGCRTLFRREQVPLLPGNERVRQRRFTFWKKNKTIEGCGACALLDLAAMGMASVKVLDRTMPLRDKLVSTAFIRACRDALGRPGHDRRRHLAFCRRLFARTFKQRCSPRDCYYPSVFSPGRRAR